MPAIQATAEARLAEGDPAGALELLVPLLGGAASGEELARINEDLARAEFLLGHFQRAAGYYEAAFALDPEADLLLELATAYDLGGDLPSALSKYLRLANWDGADEDLREMARARARDILSVIGTPTPGP
jgi:tetratricopeptide (TPR) repeat protein